VPFSELFELTKITIFSLWWEFDYICRIKFKQMKDFLKTTLAVIAGLFIMQLISSLLCFIMIAMMAASGIGSTKVPSNAVLDVNMADFVISEQATEQMPVFALSGSMQMQASVGLWDAVKALEAAADDPAVKCILLRTDMASGGYATLEEFRIALQKFRDSGKPIISYIENPGTGSYYMASVADKVYMTKHHGGNASLVGISGNMLFLKDILDKLGINFQLIRHGKYKSAGEMYIKNAPSAENLEQNRVMIESLWGVISKEIAASRHLDIDKFNADVDNLRFNFPEDFVENGLVDGLLDREELIGKLCEQAMVEDRSKLQLFAFSKYVDLHKLALPGKNNVAILYADGEIVDGKGYEGIAADRFVKEIEAIRLDKSVKAVVLRVNSPGGSVIASEKIKTALDLLDAEKPVVASYGNYAASGGYWISNSCRKIYTDANTLTGSIGVFSMIPEFSKVYRNIGVNSVSVGSNKHSDMYSLNRPFDAAETAYMQASVEDIYERFVTMVATSREMEVSEVDDIAQGRVWAGTDAIGIKIVDEIGTLEDAVAYAASLAGFESEADYKVKACPAPLTFAEQLMLSFAEEEPTILSGTPFESMTDILSSLNDNRPTEVYARIPYQIEIK